MSTTDSHVVHLTDIHAVAVPVNDVDRALDFYVGTLGLRVRMDVPFGDGDRWVEVAPGDARTSVALIRARAGVPAGVDTGIRLTSTDAVADHAALRGAGADVDPEVMQLPGTPPMFGVRDPDGNALVVVGAG